MEKIHEFVRTHRELRSILQTDPELAKNCHSSMTIDLYNIGIPRKKAQKGADKIMKSFFDIDFNRNGEIC